jgi:hypothetical protein
MFNYDLIFFLISKIKGEGMVPQSKVGKTLGLKEHLQR